MCVSKSCAPVGAKEKLSNGSYFMYLRSEQTSGRYREREFAIYIK